MRTIVIGVLAVIVVLGTAGFKRTGDYANYYNVSVTYSGSQTTSDSIVYPFEAGWAESGYYAQDDGLWIETDFYNTGGTKIASVNTVIDPTPKFTTSPVNVNNSIPFHSQLRP